MTFGLKVLKTSGAIALRRWVLRTRPLRGHRAPILIVGYGWLGRDQPTNTINRHAPKTRSLRDFLVQRFGRLMY